MFEALARWRCYQLLAQRGSEADALGALWVGDTGLVIRLLVEVRECKAPDQQWNVRTYSVTVGTACC